jgi:putative tricarboxylic transport membrane protein
MIDVEGLLHGFQIVSQPYNITFVFLGCLLGTLIGVLPGLGPVATVALLFPISVKLPPVTAIIMLSGIYYGAMYGGSTTSILLKIPGETASVVTCFDGYEMARQGRAGAALGISAFGSFIAGTIGLVLLTMIAPILAEIALKIGPPEYFSLLLAALIIVSYLSSGKLWKSLFMMTLGLFLSTIGVDIMTGSPRFTFGIIPFLDGLDMVPMVMGLFGLGEVLINLEEKTAFQLLKTKIKHLFPTTQDWARSIPPIFRGTFLGFFLGVVPGGGSVVSSFISYALEKKVSKTPEKFGTGMIEGVAGPESANNSATAGAFVPLLTLGIPSHALMALLLGALIVHGVQPGPMLLQEHPEIFWGTISSMYIGNIMLLILNLPLIPVWVQILKIPYRYLYSIIFLVILIGAYTLRNSQFDLFLTIFFGIAGYFLRKFEFDLAPLVLAFVLGPMLEYALRRSMIMSDGSLIILVTRPISLAFISIGVILIFSSFIRWLFRKFKVPAT